MSQAEQANPKQLIGGAEFGFAGLAFEHRELMSERQILKRELAMGLEAGEQGAQKRPNHLAHEMSNVGPEPRRIKAVEALRGFR